MTESHGNPDAGDGAVKNPVEARQGVVTGHVRWMLRISVALSVLALGAVLVGYTATQHAPAAAHAPTIASGARDAGTS